MPHVKAKELRTIPEPELQQRLRDSRKQLAELRLQAAQGAIEQPHRIRLVRRELARIHTVLHESGHPATPPVAGPQSKEHR